MLEVTGNGQQQTISLWYLIYKRSKLTRPCILILVIRSRENCTYIFVDTSMIPSKLRLGVALVTLHASGGWHDNSLCNRLHETIPPGLHNILYFLCYRFLHVNRPKTRSDYMPTSIIICKFTTSYLLLSKHVCFVLLCHYIELPSSWIARMTWF